jgi:bacteriorhodopsin
MTSALVTTVSEIDLKKALSLVNTVSFLAYSLDEHNFSEDPNLQKNEKNALKHSSTLLAIAGAHYAVIHSADLSVQSEILVRYSDWMFTTPLLLKVVTSYYDLSNSVASELITYNLIMLIAGLIYELTGNITFWFIGVAAYLRLIYRLHKVLPELDFFFKYFVVGWGLYGVVALMPRKDRLLTYNVLDFYNKLIFAIEIRKRIGKDMKSRHTGLL